MAGRAGCEVVGMSKRYANPGTDDCPICGQILNGRLLPVRNESGWAHRKCVLAERGE